MPVNMWHVGAERLLVTYCCCFMIVKTNAVTNTAVNVSSTSSLPSPPTSTPFTEVNATTEFVRTESNHNSHANNTVIADGVIPNGYVYGDGRNGGGAALRAFYVLMGLTLIVIVYFVVRSVRLRRKRSKSHKYGVIARNGDLEMTPLDQDDEDETTVFEATNHSRN